jgi:hypothetical protein
MACAIAGGHKFAPVTILRNKLAIPDAFCIVSIPDSRPAVFHNIAHFLFKPGLTRYYIAIWLDSDVIFSCRTTLYAKA